MIVPGEPLFDWSPAWLPVALGAASAVLFAIGVWLIRRGSRRS